MSWIAQQLNAASQHASNANTQAVQNKRRALWVERAKKGWEEHTQKAAQTYRAAMFGRGWMTSWQIECALGYARTSSTPFLRKLREDLKLIERRPKGGLPYNRKSGYEFMWVGD